MVYMPANVRYGYLRNLTLPSREGKSPGEGTVRSRCGRKTPPANEQRTKHRGILRNHTRHSHFAVATLTETSVSEPWYTRGCCYGVEPCSTRDTAARSGNKNIV